MARVIKNLMLKNYFTSTTAYNGINPHKNSEILIEGNYFDGGAAKYYRQSEAVAVTWAADHYIAAATSIPSSVGSTVSVPYQYSAVPASQVPTMVKQGAGATLFR